MRWLIHYPGVVCWLAIAGITMCGQETGAGRGSAAVARPPTHRSPSDLAVVPGRDLVLTANQTADSVSLVDLRARKVLCETPCGQRPVAVACSPDGKKAAVSNLWSGSISLLHIHAKTLKVAGTVAVGAFLRGLVFSRDSHTLYAAVSGANAVVAIDFAGRKVKRRWPAPRDPRELALSPDGRWLAAASTRSGQVYCWNTSSGQLHWERKIEDAFNLTGLVFSPDSRWIVCTHSIRREFPVTQGNIAKGWVIDSRLTRLNIRPDVQPFAWQIAMDTHGQAVGDPQGGAYSPDGRWLTLAGAGTHELLILKTAAIPWTAGDPGDLIDPALLNQPSKFRRVPLGGRPMKVVFRKQAGQVVVANYLLDSVQIVDTVAGKVLRSIPLGSPQLPSPARTGEALFYDARRSHNQWFSCHTCHVDGHTGGLTFDTLNDDSYGNPKLTPSLRNVVHTGPWTWHGWQRDLGAAVEKSLTQTMFGPRPTRAETKALLAFLANLKPPPHTGPEPTAVERQAIQRGEVLFVTKARCIRCHQRPFFTSPSNYTLKLEPDGSPYRLWNPPSLIGLSERGPFFHDGRATSLDDLLRNHHRPEQLGGRKITTPERNDLIAFLKSL